MTRRAYVDTTVLTNLLLKKGELNVSASTALTRFEETLLPVYAIKEFKAGPLRRFVWLHNKIVENGYAGAMDALQRLSGTPQRYLTSTAIEALKTSAYTLGPTSWKELQKKYGSRAANFEQIQAERIWSCVKGCGDESLEETQGEIIKSRPPTAMLHRSRSIPQRWLRATRVRSGVCQSAIYAVWVRELASAPEALRALKKATDQISNAEHRRRSQALSDIARKSNVGVTEQQCRALGDAIFAFFAPEDSVVLTTNTRDMEPLAAALGKKSESP